MDLEEPDLEPWKGAALIVNLRIPTLTTDAQGTCMGACIFISHQMHTTLQKCEDAWTELKQDGLGVRKESIQKGKN
jgi:hypothetical protein